MRPHRFFLVKGSSTGDLAQRVASATILLACIGFVFWAGTFYILCLLPVILLRLWWEAYSVSRTGQPRHGGRYVFLAAIALAFLACSATFHILFRPAGLQILLGVCIVVWMADSFAYFVGNRVRGPLLAPRISPKKTWSGIAGGLVGGELGGFAYLKILGKYPSPKILFLVGLIVFLSQTGDLLESAAKRFWGVKDSGQIIPGHGGLWDRLDGLILALLGTELALEAFF